MTRFLPLLMAVLAPRAATVGGSAKVVDPALPEPQIIARVDRGKAVASLRCPHRGVEIEYQPVPQRFRCASLGHSKFALDGAKLGGPAPRPIKAYPAFIDGGNLVIRL